MKTSLTLFALTLSILALSPTPAHAAKGELIATARCMCAASMIVKIGNRQGNIANDQKVDSVTLGANDKLVRIEKPEAGIRDYYVIYDLSKYPQVLAALSAAGIDASRLDRVTLESFEAADDTPLFADHNATRPIR